MSHSWHNLLVRNSLFELFEGCELYCVLCECETTEYNVTKHLASSRHVSHLEWFTMIYNQFGGNVECKYCQTIVTWDMIKLHALSHADIEQLVLIGNESKYRRLFDNRTIEIEDKFHCCICDSTHHTKDDILKHFDSINHANNKEKILLDENFIKRFPASFKLLVTECIYMLEKGNFICKICDCQSVFFYAINKHVDSTHHRKKKSSFQLEWKKSLNHNSTSPTVENIEKNYSQVESPLNNVMEEEVAPQVSKDLNYTTLLRNYNLYCVLCECEISQWRKSVHFRTSTHMDALKHYGCDDIIFEGDNYYCKNCDCLVNSVNNVYLHIKGKKHLQAVKRNMIDNYAAEENFTSNHKVSEFDENLCIYLVELENSDVLCKSCNCILTPSIENQIKHVSGRSHKRSLKQNGRDKIVRKENYYYCTCCDIDINDFEKVFEHIEEESHVKSTMVEIMRESLMEPTNNSVQSPIYEPRNNDQEAPENPLKAYGWDNISMIDDNYYCSYCNCSMSGHHNVNEHVKGKRHLQQVYLSLAYGRGRQVPNIDTKTLLQANGNQSLAISKTRVKPEVQNVKQPVAPLKIQTIPQANQMQPRVQTKIITKPESRVNEPQSIPKKISPKPELQMDSRNIQRPNIVAQKLLQSISNNNSPRAPTAYPLKSCKRLPPEVDEASRMLGHCSLYKS